MKVRAATSEDARQCAEISRIRPTDELTRMLRQNDVTWLVIEDDSGIVVGIGIIHLWTWNKVAWVWDLTIDEPHRGKGFGRTLLKGMTQAARKMGARVLMDFESPRAGSLTHLYLESGFRVCGTNDRWFACEKDPTAVFYGYDL